MQNGHMARTVWIIGLMRPSIDNAGRGMIVQVEDLHNPFPHCLALKRLFHGDATNMRGLYAVNVTDRFSQFSDVILIHDFGGATISNFNENGRPCSALSAFLNTLSKL